MWPGIDEHDPEPYHHRPQCPAPPDADRQRLPDRTDCRWPSGQPTGRVYVRLQPVQSRMLPVHVQHFDGMCVHDTGTAAVLGWPRREQCRGGWECVLRPKHTISPNISHVPHITRVRVISRKTILHGPDPFTRSLRLFAFHVCRSSDVRNRWTMASSCIAGIDQYDRTDICGPYRLSGINSIATPWSGRVRHQSLVPGEWRVHIHGIRTVTAHLGRRGLPATLGTRVHRPSDRGGCCDWTRPIPDFTSNLRGNHPPSFIAIHITITLPTA